MSSSESNANISCGFHLWHIARLELPLSSVEVWQSCGLTGHQAGLLITYWAVMCMIIQLACDCMNVCTVSPEKNTAKYVCEHYSINSL